MTSFKNSADSLPTRGLLFSKYRRRAWEAEQKRSFWGCYRGNVVITLVCILYQQRYDVLLLSHHYCHHLEITMLVSTVSRSLLRSNGALFRQNVRLMSSVASSEKQSAAAVGHNSSTKREIHSDAPQMKSAPPLQYAAPPTYMPEEAEKEEVASTSGMADRFKITAEVTVSKIFPAGFG